MSSEGRLLRRLRGEQSQRAFAARAGITRAALASYETGRVRPKPSLVREICARVGVADDACEAPGIVPIELTWGDLGLLRSVVSLKLEEIERVRTLGMSDPGDFLGQLRRMQAKLDIPVERLRARIAEFGDV